MATNDCKRCGTPLSPNDKFCSNCGQPLDAAPTVTQESYEAPPASTPPLAPSSRFGAAFWLGLLGAIFGLLLGGILLGYGFPSEVFFRGLGLVIFSILGIVGALRIFEGSELNNALLMFIAGVLVLGCWIQYGILPALLFFVGGALLLLKKG